MLGRSADGNNSADRDILSWAGAKTAAIGFLSPKGTAFAPRRLILAKLSDPSLIIYSPVRVLGKSTIVTNGDQTDTIYDFMAKGMSFEDALRTRTFEPDEPNFTPRISGTVRGAGYAAFHLEKRRGESGRQCIAFSFDYTDALPGQGHVIHTYRENGDPIPSFEGEPVLVEMTDEFEAFGEKLWCALNADNKVSLFVRSIDLSTGKTETKIYNKNK